VLWRQVAGDRALGDPNFKSSPWIRGPPQVGFSATIDRMRLRSSGLIFGRPERRRARKRRGTWRDASPRRSPASRSRARSPILTTNAGGSARRDDRKGSNWGLGFLRLRTPTCCRKPTSSSPRSCRERKKAPNQERKARRKRTDHGSSLQDAVHGKAGSASR
jgi:hypothetical protein